MNLHDLIFMLGGILLTLTTLPGLRSGARVPLGIACGYAVVLGTFTVNYFTMQFFLTGITCAAQTAIWAAIAWRVVRSDETRDPQRTHG